MAQPEAPTLAAGTRLGPYEIQALIGAGGMGQVYRALDTRLERIVAVKILPAHLAGNEQIRERFKREGKAISALKHPNICALYDVGEHEGILYLVMEYIDGKPPRGPMLPDALHRCASEFAAALDHAHRSGFIHRDLKPGNILIAKEGAKLLDFGLAKAIAPPAPPEDGATRTEPLTKEGTLMGTFAYMAPEQMEGLASDARADIWAFGAVLYELATGKRAFEGANQIALTLNIARSEPPPASIPPALDRIIRRCIKKDPEERWQTARDLVIELREMGNAQRETPSAARETDTAPPPTPPPAPPASKLPSVGPWQGATVALALVAAILGALYFRRDPPPEQAAIRFEVVPPNGRLFAQFTRISPDGRKLAFLVGDNRSTARIWIRPLDSTEAFPLAGTEGAASGSIDMVAFTQQGTLKKTSISGGVSVRVCDCPGLAPTDWGRDGTIYLASGKGPVQGVPASGGVPRPITKLDASRGETAHDDFSLSLDQKRFVYRTLGTGDKAAVYLGSFDGAPPKRLDLAEARRIHYGAGHLLYNRGAELMAQRLDHELGSPVGEPFRLANAAPTSGASISQNGVLAYSPDVAAFEELVMVDRTGNRLASFAPTSGIWAHAEISPDGRKLAVDRREGSRYQEVWTIDIARNAAARLTFEPGALLPPGQRTGRRSITRPQTNGLNVSPPTEPASRSGCLPRTRTTNTRRRTEGGWPMNPGRALRDPPSGTCRSTGKRRQLGCSTAPPSLQIRNSRPTAGGSPTTPPKPGAPRSSSRASLPAGASGWFRGTAACRRVGAATGKSCTSWKGWARSWPSM